MKDISDPKRGDAERDARALAELAADKDGTAVQPSLGSVVVPYIGVAALRAKLGMTQKRFSEVFGFSSRTVQNWEQQRRLPDRSARVLLKVIERHPEEVAGIARAIG